MVRSNCCLIESGILCDMMRWSKPKLIEQFNSPMNSLSSPFIIATIKSIIPIDREVFSEIVKLRSRKLSNFELYRVLERSANEINSLKEEFPDIDKSDEIKKIQSSIVDIDNIVDDATLYYNDNISIYNKLLMKFPSNIVANVSKYKEKLYFDRKNMSDEDYNDFKL